MQMSTFVVVRNGRLHEVCRARNYKTHYRRHDRVTPLINTDDKLHLERLRLFEMAAEECISKVINNLL